MYVEKDLHGQIIIQNISLSEAKILDDCFCSYLADKTKEKRTEKEKVIVKLKRELEKLY